MSQSPIPVAENRLLASLPRHDRQHLLARCEQVDLRFGDGNQMRALRPAESKGEADTCNRAEEKQGILAHLASLLVSPSGPRRANWRPLPDGPVRPNTTPVTGNIRPHRGGNLEWQEYRRFAGIEEPEIPFMSNL